MTITMSNKKIRGPRLVARILDAALEEIARAGYERLSIDEVARRAEVNKTTIYRRWPDSDALALAAIEHGSTDDTMPDHGSLREDVIDYLKQVRTVCRTPAMLSLSRLQLSGGLTGRVGQIVKERMEQTDCNARVMFERAVARGEVSREVDIDLLQDLALGSVQHVMVFQHRHLDDATLERMVDVVITGVQHLDWSLVRPPGQPA